jgi:glutathione S-transferase
VLRVYHREYAGRPIRALWTLEEIGAPYELTLMSWEEGSAEEHRARHPLGRVPVLEDDEGYVFESTAICLHLADLHPQAELLPPPGTHERALAYQWSCFAPAELEPPLIEAAIFRGSDPARAAKARGHFVAAAGAMELPAATMQGSVRRPQSRGRAPERAWAARTTPARDGPS